MASISKHRIADLLNSLSHIGNLGHNINDGFFRASWSDEESMAMEFIKEFCHSFGLISSYDAIGNLFITTPSNYSQLLQIGSHIDTVPNGGLYDGGAGIIIGLETILSLKNIWNQLPFSIQLVVWRGEESATFGDLCKGSKAAFGLNNPKILERKFNGKTLWESIKNQGFNPGYILNRIPTLTQEHINNILTHFEIHIEQASSLETEGLDFGIVTGIRGTYRIRVNVTGEAAHSGATPMGVKYRKDANLAIAYMQVELDKLANSIINNGGDLVQTVGIVNTDPSFNLDEKVKNNNLTTVSAFGFFTIDVRSTSIRLLRIYINRVKKLIFQVGRKFEVKTEIFYLCFINPVEKLDCKLSDLSKSVCNELGYKCKMMASGALHDLAVVSTQKKSDGSLIPASLIFIPCRGGISHNKHEYTSIEAMYKGVTVLVRIIARIASQKKSNIEIQRNTYPHCRNVFANSFPGIQYPYD
jgi:hydantoinase/carbamoylase family amidase